MAWNWRQLDKFKSILRCLRPWVDTSTYRPLIALVAVSLMAFLAPLALDVADALFFWLPRWFR